MLESFSEKWQFRRGQSSGSLFTERAGGIADQGVVTLGPEHFKTVSAKELKD